MIAVLDIGGTQIKYGVYDQVDKELIVLGTINTGPFEQNFSMVSKGQTVEEVDIHIYDGIKWINSASFGVIGYQRMIDFDEVLAHKIKISFVKFRKQMNLSSVYATYQKNL